MEKDFKERTTALREGIEKFTEWAEKFISVFHKIARRNPMNFLANPICKEL